jgi:hypothetical protein
MFVLDVKNKEFLKGLNLTELGRLRLDLIIELASIGTLNRSSNRVL